MYMYVCVYMYIYIYIRFPEFGIPALLFRNFRARQFPRSCQECAMGAQNLSTPGPVRAERIVSLGEGIDFVSFVDMFSVTTRNMYPRPLLYLILPTYD